MARSEPILCRFCRSRHMPRYLCDEAQQVLQMVAERADRDGTGVNTAGLEPLRLQPGADTVLSRLVVLAATVRPAPGVARAAVVFTGQDIGGRPLPRWTYVAADDTMERAKDLIGRRFDEALTQARQGR